MKQAELVESWKTFQDRYAKDACRFVVEQLHASPDAKQKIILDAVSRGERRITVRSGHGVGKTAVISWIVLWFLFTRFPQKTAITAPSSGQLFDALWPEIGKWRERLSPDLRSMVEITGDRIRLIAAPNESFVTAKTSRAETPEAMAGVHEENVLLVADEASGVPNAVFEAASGSMSSDNAIMILTGNPVRSSGYFYDTHMRLPGWFRVHISCLESAQVSKHYIEEKKVEYGEDSNAYRVRVLGEFPLADDNTVIPIEHIELAQMRDIEVNPNELIYWGVDIARFGSNSSAIAKRQGACLLEPILTWNGADTMASSGLVYNEFRDSSARPEKIHIDAVGVGSGVYDRLLEFDKPRIPVVGINVGESPALKEKYVNLRSELWWTMREWFAAKQCWIPKDERLLRDLVGPRYKLNSKGQIQVETKAEMSARGVPSPDTADALMLTFASDAGIALHGRAARRSQHKRRVIRMSV